MTAIATSAPAVAPRLSRYAIVQALAALVAMAAVLFAPQVFNDGDTWWHLATGRWILAHGRVPHADVFSFPHLGQPWVAHEWLSEVFMALAYRAGGWSGIAMLFAAATGLTATLLAARLGRALSGLTLVATVTLAASCVAPSLLIRPHLLVLPIIVLWTSELLAAREAGRAPRLWLAPLMALWANMHGSYLLGFLVAAPFGLEALAAAAPGERLKAARDWGLAGLLCLAAILVTPHGLAGVRYPFQILSMTTLPAITEWRSPDFSRLAPFELVLLATLFVGMSRGVRVPPLRLALLLVLLHMTLQHQRQLIVLAVIAPLILARPLAQALGQAPTEPAPSRPVWTAFAAVALALFGLRAADPVQRPDADSTPRSALAHVPPALTRLPMFNTYDFGGYLIFQGVRPFIDGRSDMYGDAHFKRALRLRDGDRAELARAVAQDHIAWTLLAPSERLVPVLDAQPGWRRLYADRYAVVHVRTDVWP